MAVKESTQAFMCIHCDTVLFVQMLIWLLAYF